MEHSVRHKQGGKVTIDNYSRAMAIRLQCTECMGWESDPKGCTANICPLFPFRGISKLNVRKFVQGKYSPVEGYNYALSKSGVSKYPSGG